VAIPLDLWDRMIEHYKSCPFTLLQNTIGRKPLTRDNIKQVRHLIETMKIHEGDIRNLRKEIEEKVNEYEASVST
jgi:hypothetical protein